MTAFVEGALQLDFAGAQSAEKLDRRGEPMPVGMSLVDFVVEEAERVLLLEVKDPSDPSAQEKAQRRFVRQLAGDQLVNHELVPKARDSYTLLHLMERDTKPMILVLLLGDDRLRLDPALLLALKDRLLARTRQEAAEPWKRQYVADCVVATLATWPNVFPSYSVARAAAGGAGG